MRRHAGVLLLTAFGLALAFAVRSAPVLRPKPLYSDYPPYVMGRTQKPGTTHWDGTAGGDGCAGCHDASGGPIVSISGPAALYPGQRGTYAISATRAGFDGRRMGIDLASQDANALSVFPGEPTVTGTLTLIGGGTVTTDEVIHTDQVCADGSTSCGTAGKIPLHTLSSGTASYQFYFTMPTSAAISTNHTLYGVSAVGGYASGTAAGWAHAPNFTVTAAAPAPPTNLAAGTTTSGSIPLSWTASTEAAASYRVVYKQGSTAPTSPTDGTTSDTAATSTTVAGLTPLTQYTFAVYSKVTFNGQTTFSTTAPTVTASTRAPADYYVNAATGLNSNDGLTPTTAFKTVTKGVASAAAGDRVNVAAGTYNVALGETFPITMLAGRKLIGTSGAEVTIVDAAGANDHVFICQGDSNTLLQGLTITGALYITPNIGSNSNGGGVFCDFGDQTTITRCIITGNEVRGYAGNTTSAPSGGQAYGGGVYVSATTVLTNNIISNNVARGGQGVDRLGSSTSGGSGGGGDGGGVFAGFGTVTLINNTFYGNHAAGGNGGFSLGQGGSAGNGSDGGAAVSSTGVARNNIFINNSATGGTGGSGTPPGSNGSGFVGGLSAAFNNNVTNNLFFSNTADGSPSDGDTGTAAVLADPLLHSPTNFHLRYASPAIGAGTATGAPAVDFDGTTRANPPSIGAYEATALTPTSTACVTPTAGNATAVGSTGVSVNLSAVNGNVCADFFASGRTGSVPTSNASAYFWTVATTATSLSGTVTFDYSGIANNGGVGNPTTVQLLKRNGSGTPWTTVSSVTRSGNTISTDVTGFSDFALGGLLGATSTSLTSSVSPSTFGQSVTFTATVTGTGATGTVTFKDGSTTLGTGTLSSGTATFSTSSLAVGAHSITAVYEGDSAFASSTSNAITQTVNKASTTTTLISSANPSVTGQPVTFTAGVSPSTASGTITFFDGATMLGSQTISGGSAAFTTSSLTAGTHSITASYGGDASFLSSTSTALSQTVSASLTVTTTTLTSSVNPSTYGQSTTLTGTVSGSGGPPTGSVTFYDGTTALATVALSAGSASFSTAALTGGTHNLTATYDGNSTFAGSSSSTVVQTVNKASTTTTLGSSVNPAAVGQTIIFTATVSPSAASGTVTFMEGATTLGAGALSSGTATLSTSSLAAGTHSITASYGGDTNYATSTSSTLTQVVNPPGTAPTVAGISPNAGSASGGTSVTITGTGFQSGATVTMGGTAATNVTFVSATSLTARTPAHAAGVVDIVVTNPDSLSGALTGGFTYKPPGDANGDGQVTVADVFYLINNLFVSGPAAVSGDANGDGQVTVADVFYLINYLFAGGAAPR